MATPLQQDLKIYQGETFQFTFTYYTDSTKTTPVDLSSPSPWTARMQVRQKVSSGSPITGLDLTSAGGDIALGGDASGTVVVTISATVTAALPLNYTKKTWVYDLEVIDPSSVVTRLAEGKVFAFPEITR